MFTIKEYDPVVSHSGFYMEGYYVWCGSLIKGPDGLYYLFAARWPEETTFPIGYMTHSEIVLATTPSLDQPFQFQKVVISAREGDYWDAGMAHNPFVIQVDNQYVMFYIGTQNGSCEKRAIGYATADRLDGEWTRSDVPLDLPANANNPSLLIDHDGSFLLYYRDGQLKVSVARAKHWQGPYEILQYDLFPQGLIEDMYVFHANGRYEMFAEDAQGVFTGNVKAGVHFVSDNGIDWIPHEHPAAYGYEIDYTDGTHLQLQRRERPQVFIENDKAYLITTAKINGPDRLTGGHTWNMVQPFKLQ